MRRIRYETTEAIQDATVRELHSTQICDHGHSANQWINQWENSG